MKSCCHGSFPGRRGGGGTVLPGGTAEVSLRVPRPGTQGHREQIEPTGFNSHPWRCGGLWLRSCWARVRGYPSTDRAGAGARQGQGRVHMGTPSHGRGPVRETRQAPGTVPRPPFHPQPAYHGEAWAPQADIQTLVFPGPAFQTFLPRGAAASGARGEGGLWVHTPSLSAVLWHSGLKWRTTVSRVGTPCLLGRQWM